MSLLKDAMERCVMLHKVSAADDYGSDYTRWVEGTEFDAAIVFDTSIEARVAESQGVTSVYTVVTSRAKMLEYHDVFKRLRDGKIFRCTSDGDDKLTPSRAGIDARQVTAEEFTPTGSVSR